VAKMHLSLLQTAPLWCVMLGAQQRGLYIAGVTFALTDSALNTDCKDLSSP